MALIEKAYTFHTPAGTVLKNANVSVYFNKTSTAARVFDAGQNLKDAAPQLTTDDTGYVLMYFDDDDFQTGQTFDLVASPDAKCNPTENEVHLIGVGLTTNWSEIADDNGHKPADDADVTPPLPSDEKLGGYWSFDELTGSTAKDSSGNDNDGTLNNMENADWVVGKSGNCLDFGGTNEYVSVAHDAVFDFGTNSFSVSYWMRFPAGSSQQKWSIGKGAPYIGVGAGWAIAHWSTGDPLVPILYFSDGVDYISITFGNMTRGTWYLLTFVVDRSANLIKTYLNGEFVGNSSSISSYGSVNSADDLLIGAGNTVGNTSICKIDEVRIYSQALTAQEVKALYLNPSGLKSPIPGSDVTLDQLAGNGVNVCHARYSSFEEASLPPVVYGNGTVTQDSGVSYFGGNSLKMAASAADHWCFLGATQTDYNIKITPNKKWIVSAPNRCDQVSKACQIFVKTSDAGVVRGIAGTSHSTLNTWKRVSGIIDLTSDDSTQCLIRLDNDGGNGVNMWWDGIMLEEQFGNLEVPSVYALPSGIISGWDSQADETGTNTADNTEHANDTDTDSTYAHNIDGSLNINGAGYVYWRDNSDDIAGKAGGILAGSIFLIQGQTLVNVRLESNSDLLSLIANNSNIATKGMIEPGDLTPPDFGTTTNRWGNAFTNTVATRQTLAVSGNSDGSMIIAVTNTDAARTVTLRTADCINGKIIIIKDESAGAGTNNITIATEGAETIDGFATGAIAANKGARTIYSNGSNWFYISSY